MAHMRTIEGPWASLAENEARRVDSKGRFDFFWVRMPDGAPGLVLRLSAGVEEVRPLPKLKHVGVFYRVVEGANHLCITLSEFAHIDLFETLCRDVVSAGEEAADLQGALGRAVRRAMRWHHLLRGGKQGMPLEVQRGLVGELAFLRELVAVIGPSKAVEAWKGPDDSAKDFELPGMFFEVKARRSAAHPKIRISSEAQLMDIVGAQLFLRVQDVDTALDAEGDNLKDHVDRTAKLFEDDVAALDVWEQRIAESPYAEDAVEPERRWHLGAARLFQVVEGFPRIVPPLPAGTEELAYSIRLDACTGFETTTDLKTLLLGETRDVGA
ncbi:PD-(D/E)XK motif protein [Rhodovulum sulfidophilum]|uniref:PD-(D/E)XK motif protein n=1 Tax=Rhodovulum sulfidophilum TaxID=35806 RepID=UPI0019214D94|nr:PD-(D/E)XK motif protein [Rhodovulum sulfidophilum]MBL3564714.1 PD-(D/E)XK motif protein [Rhodovulum sulfidophilum]